MLWINYKKFISRKKLVLALTVALVVVLVVLGFVLFETKNQQLEVIFLDIGQGDAILIKTPGKQNILIDGGPDKSVVYKLDEYLPLHNRQIDLMTLTHPDNDHITGLVEVLKRFPVIRVLSTGVINSTSSYLAWQEEAKKKNLDQIIAKENLVVNLGRGVKMTVLWPKKNLFGVTIEDTNFTSIVVRLDYGATSFLFTGDAPIEVEKILIDEGLNLKANVLKVGHHGSKYSTSKNFLKAVQPKFGVISVGKNNNFGHPTLRVLKNLENARVKTLRTDQSGDIIFISNGENLWLKTEK